MRSPLSDELAAAWRIARRELLGALGGRYAADSADRRLLERCILPHYAAREDVRALLFVGTCRATRHYAALLPGKRFLTIDADPAAARHGSPGAHIVGDVCDIAARLAPGSVDVAVMNGVFGWGLDRPEAMQRALLGLHRVLRPGGELVVGWNDVPRRRPFDWHALPALRAFEPVGFAPLGGAQLLRVPTDNRHCFEFLRKACVAPDPSATACRPPAPPDPPP